MTAANYITVLGTGFGGALNLSIYDGPGTSEWLDSGSGYSFAQFSSGSGASERWASQALKTGTVSDSNPESAAYYHQYRPSVALSGISSSDTVSTEAHIVFGAPHPDAGIQSGPWSDWADNGSVLGFSGTTSGGKVTSGQRVWTVGSAFSGSIAYLIPVVSMTFRAVTSNAGAHGDMSSGNAVTVSYRNQGADQTVQVWDGQDATVDVDQGSTYSFSQSSSASGNTHRWWSRDVLTGTASENGTIAKNYLEQYKKIMFVNTQEPGNHMDTGNFAVLTVSQFNGEVQINLYDFDGQGGSSAEWLDAGSIYSFSRVSSASDETARRWMSESPLSGSVGGSESETCTYYHQYRPEIILGGTSADDSVGAESHVKFGTGHGESGQFGTWSDWADKGSTLVFSAVTTRGRTTESEHIWLVNSAFSKTILYELAPTPTPSPTAPPPTATPTVAPTVTPAPTPEPTLTPAPSPSPTPTTAPTPTPSPVPTSTPTPIPSPTQSPTPVPTTTPVPTPGQAVDVWPGDMDNDGTVDAYDVMRIGACWNCTGSPRLEASLIWYAQHCSGWTPSEAVFADADGNGFVEENDLAAIETNYGKTHQVVAGLLGLLFTPLIIIGLAGLRRKGKFPPV
jgi:hypothetical protein